jgi:hypothetical protein
VRNLLVIAELGVDDGEAELEPTLDNVALGADDDGVGGRQVDGELGIFADSGDKVSAESDSVEGRPVLHRNDLVGRVGELHGEPIGTDGAHMKRHRIVSREGGLIGGRDGDDELAESRVRRQRRSRGFDQPTRGSEASHRSSQNRSKQSLLVARVKQMTAAPENKGRRAHSLVFRSESVMNLDDLNKLDALIQANHSSVANSAAESRAMQLLRRAVDLQLKARKKKGEKKKKRSVLIRN